MRNELGGPPQLVVWRCFTVTKPGVREEKGQSKMVVGYL
jgi:hypothetical protein